MTKVNLMEEVLQRWEKEIGREACDEYALQTIERVQRKKKTIAEMSPQNALDRILERARNRGEQGG